MKFREIAIPEETLKKLEAEPNASLEQLGLLQLINKEAEAGYVPVWETFLKTRFIIFEKID